MPLFANSSGFSARGNFADNSTTIVNVSDAKPGPDRPGLEKLLDKSIPEAAYDSSDRHPPPLCHPGTRDQLIEEIVSWGRNVDGTVEGIAWVKGPAGSGKSAVCQSSADSLGERLGASFFFSRPNRRSDPKRFFTTIAYQLAVKYELYGKLLDEKIRKDSTIITKSLPVQFRELIALPVCEALRSCEALSGTVVIADGLDECEGPNHQNEILDIIARSVMDKTAPFRWIISSRLEPHIVSRFDHPTFKPITLQFEVTISRDLDPAVFRFLADKLVEIRVKHGLNELWPRQEDLHTLVELSSGMFAYSHVIALFVDDDDSTSPVEQLNLVLRLAQQTNSGKGSKHPLARLDLFYATLILERLPQEKSRALRVVLLADQLLCQLDSGLYIRGVEHAKNQFTQAKRCANLLRYSEQEFRLLCRSFHAVMVVDPNEKLKFYHASFMDFLLDPARSGQFSIHSLDCVMKLLDLTKEALEGIKIDSELEPVLHITWGIASKEQYAERYYDLVTTFLKVLGLAIFAGNMDRQRCAVLKEWDFRKLALFGAFDFEWKPYTPAELYDCWRKRGGELIRPYITAVRSRSLSYFLGRMIETILTTKNDFILGHGKKSVDLQYVDRFSRYNVTIGVYPRKNMKKFKQQLYQESLAKGSLE